MQTTHSTTRSLKDKQRQEREGLILQVAEDVLVEKGYYETSMDEIAARVGIAKGTVYLHFPSKEDLVVAIFERDMQQFWQELEAAIAPMSTAHARLEAALYCLYSGLYNKRAKLLYSIANTIDVQRLFKTNGSGCLRETWERLAGEIAELLEEGKATGEFDTTIPTNIMLSAFFGLLSPKGYERLVIKEQVPAEELVSHLGRLYFKGIAAI